MIRKAPAWVLMLGGLLLLFLVANLAVTLRNTRELRDDAKWVAHSHEVIANLESLLALSKEATMSIRGYVITGDEKFLRPYEASREALGRELDAVQNLTADNLRQQGQLPKVREQIDRLAEILERTRRLREESGWEAAQEQVATGQSEERVQTLEGLIDGMITHENGLLRGRAERTRQTYQSAIVTASLSGVASMVGLAAFYLLLRRHWMARSHAAFVIAEQAERLRTTLASIGDGVITTDREGRVTGLNAVAERLTGWTSAEAASVPLEQVFHIINEETRAEAANPAIRSLSEGVIVGLANHTLLIARDGAERPIDDSAAPIRCAEGAIVGCVLVFRDVGERRALEHELNRRLADAQRLATIVADSNEAIVSKTLDGVIRTWNAAAERLFGYSAADAIGQPITLLIPSDRLAEEEAILARLRAGERIERYETQRRRSDGQLIWVQLTISPLRDEEGRIVGASKIALDVSARREIERRERQLLAEAAAANAKFRAFFEHGPVFAGIVDLDGVLVEMNRLSWEYCGFTREQALGKPFWEGPWWSPSAELSARIREACAQAAEGREFRAEMSYYVANGSERVVDLAIQPIADESGQILFLAPTGTDITDRKLALDALRESEERFRTMADNISQFAWMADAKGWIYWYNRRWYEYTGTTLAEMQGWGWRKAHHPDHVERVVERIQLSWDTGIPWEDTFPLRGADGQYRWFLSRAQPIRDAQGKILRWFGTNTDITEQRELEDELRQLAADLAESDQRKTEFLAMLAHELRNPLAPIRTAVEILRREPAGGVHRAEAVDMIARQVEQMVRLIDDLLDLSRISLGKFELRRQPLDVIAVLSQACATSRATIEKAGQSLTCALPDEAVLVDGDAVRLTQVFSNLLSNASKYSRAGDQIHVAAGRDDADLVVSVRDTGMGIPAAMLPHIFDMFAQGEQSQERSQGGLGVGLTLVDRIVRLHGGSVSAASAGPGRGSEFTIRLPTMAVGAAPTPPIDPPNGDERATSRRSILVVDDNRDAALSLSLLLKLQGNVTRTAHDGLEAVAVAEEFRPDVVLLDIGLPKLNGYDAVRRIREQPWGRQMLVVALTGWGHDEDRRKSREAGFDAHLVKPVEHAALVELLASLRPMER